MKSDNIGEIRIDDLGRLCIFPEKEQFSFIWRSATEVHWDDKGSFLFSPKPREWSYFDWYTQIVGAVKSEYGFELLLTNETIWFGISDNLKKQIQSFKLS